MKNILHFKSGTSWDGLPYSLCTYSTKVVCVGNIKNVTCKNCLIKLDKIHFKKELREKAENDISLLAKSIRKDNIIQITRACNQIWEEYIRNSK